MAKSNLAETLLDSEHLPRFTREIEVELARRCAARKDILGWAQILFPHKFYLPFCRPLHDHIVSERLAPRTGMEAPRNHAKTTVKCLAVELFQALEEPELFQHYMNVQSTEDKAIALNIAIRNEVENNDIIHSLYGDMTGPKWTDHQFVLRNGTVFSAVGAGQSIRGYQYEQRRPDYIVVDDLHDEKDIYSPDQTIKKVKWFWGAMYPARAKSKRNCIHVQGTATNSYDLLKDISGKDRWRFKTFQACDMETKKVLWPELNTFPELMAERTDMGSIIFERELQNVRRSDTDSLIKRSWWRYYSQAPHPTDLLVHSWDMSFKETSDGSFVVGQVWCRKGADFFLLDQVRARMDFPTSKQAVRNLLAKWPNPNAVVIEDKANGPAIISELTTVVPGVIAYQTEGSKEARAAAHSGLIESGHVLLPDPESAPWVNDYVEEHAEFPSGKNDDQVDATSQALDYMKSKLIKPIGFFGGGTGYRPLQANGHANWMER